MLAGDGSPPFLHGEQSHSGPDLLISDLKRIPVPDFVAVNTHGLLLDSYSGQARTTAPLTSASYGASDVEPPTTLR